MTTFSPIDLVVRHAVSFQKWAKETSTNAGQCIDEWLRRVGWTRPAPWCMAYATCMGKDMLGDAWPVPMTASCDVVLEWARKKKVVYNSPVRGDLALRLASPNDADHTFFIVDVRRTGTDIFFSTIEGNTGLAGQREGTAVLSHERLLKPGKYVFVRWVEAMA